MPTVADLRVRFSADTKDAERGIKNIDNSIKDVARSKGVNLSDMFNFAGGQMIAGAISNIGSALISVGGQAFTAYADVERLSMSLETFAARELINAGAANTMGEAIAMSGERAQEMLGWIRSLATESPFNASDIASAFRLAQAYGFTSTQAQRLTQATVDYAAGAGISGPAMDKITLALGQIQARGKLSAGEINQLSEAGINVRQILATAFGKSTAQIIEMTEKGLIPADLAIEAITRSLETDFGGAAKRQAGTFSGLISSLQDIKEFSLTDFIGGSARAVQPVLQNIVDMLSNPAMKENIIAWGDAFGTYLAGKIQYVQGLLAQVSQSATFSGGLFAALGSLTGGEVQITAEGLITSVNWGDFIGVLDWKNYIASLTWGDFVGTFAWADAVTSLAWGDFVLAFDWDDWVGTFAWGDFVSIVNWGDWVYTLSWGDFLVQLDWGNFVFGFQWGDYVYQLGWSDFIGLFDWTSYAVGLNWGDFVGSFNWADKVLSLQWGDYIGVFSWDKWIAVINWGDHVYRLAWSDFVSGITWTDYALKLNWGDFLFSVNWGEWIAVLAWGDFMSAADWGNWIYTLTWGDYVVQLDWSQHLATFTGWATYISQLTWTDVITAFTGWSAYISQLTWTDIITTALDWATWIPALAWNEFVALIDWVTWLTTLDWGSYIPAIDWNSFVTAIGDWGAYIAALDWGQFIKSALDWGGYVGGLTWESFVSKLDWPSEATQFAWSSWISKLTWPSVDWGGWGEFIPDFAWPTLTWPGWADFIPKFTWPSIPSFPGWSSIFGGSGVNPGATSSGSIGGNAAGTDSWRGGWTWVGEKGPELLNLPKGSQVLSNSESMKMVGQLADGTTTAPAVWPGGGNSFADNYEARIAQGLVGAGDKVATRIGRTMNAAADKMGREIEGALQSVPGLFGTSQVTAQQMDMAALGVPQNFADDWIRRLTDEVVNGVDWSDTDIQDAALRAGIDPSLPAKAILEMVKAQWNDSSFFAGGKNTELINQDAVRAALAQQAAAASGEAAIKQLFGVSPAEVMPAAQAMGGNMRAGIEQGLAAGGTGGGSLLSGMTNITPEQIAPVGAGLVSGLATELGKDEYKDQIGAAFTQLFTGFLSSKEALTDVGGQIMTRISESLGNATGVDMIGRFALAMRAQLTLPDAIDALHDVGARILEFVFQGYFDAAKTKNWPLATIQLPATTTSGERVALPSGARAASGLVAAGAGGPTVNVYANVANGVDIHQLAYRIGDILQKRGR